jgi:hypothetical protein
VSALNGGERSRYSSTRPAARLVRSFGEERRAERETRLAEGSLACPRCDAPVLLGGVAVSPVHALACPFCDHAGPLRDFLSLARPTRPARVIVRVTRRDPT